MAEESMGFLDKLTDRLGAVADKINNLRYIMVIKNAFTTLIPIVITGAFGTLFSNMVFGADNGLAGIDGLGWLTTLKPISDTMSNVTLSFIALYVAFLMGLELAKLNKVNGYFAGIVSVASYIAVNTLTYSYTTDDGLALEVPKVLATQYTDSKGLFLAMIVAIASVELWCWMGRNKHLQIHMPDTVPPNVSQSFSSLIPSILTIAIFGAVGLVIYNVTGMYAYDIIYNVIQQPLMAVTQGLPGILLLMLVAQVFWVIGIHGNQMIKPIREPLLIAAITANAEAFAAGQPLPNIITMPFWDVYMSMGGSGVTIGLLIAIFLVGKRADQKEIAKLSLPCGIFNINEPVIFGMPIMLNPILAIPFIITPLVTGTIGYIATVSGFAAPAVVYTPWPTPPIISAYLSTAGSIGAVITQIICIAVSVLIYLPFVIAENRSFEREQKQAEAAALEA